MSGTVECGLSAVIKTEQGGKEQRINSEEQKIILFLRRRQQCCQKEMAAQARIKTQEIASHAAAGTKVLVDAPYTRNGRSCCRWKKHSGRATSKEGNSLAQKSA